MSATYSPEDNKLRLSSVSRLPAELYKRVKDAGFSWAPRQEISVAPMWTPGREDLLIELCGEIGDEDTGRHSRFDELEFGASWEDLVRNGESFPSSNTTVGLGRSFAWNQWARVNDVVDENFKVRRSDKRRFIAIADAMRGPDNALDRRAAKVLVEA